ncbi:type 1 glutamine amidotransferase [Neptuniibacter sp. CAU 1671]|uniref:type 1 glutamine amidotransferase n=1 Tax=Neptuniibacter sp. CAU 1671 TaxID=3032593 RepID=UPI0023D9DFCF|nr:type 1 glutamine amidotransferase [Neptuniibacter sp. CAU 1671]MDF2180947.1 type 1 glutamine amidotransferase [Neptuniibacter sp. CAU 1671]
MHIAAIMAGGMDGPVESGQICEVIAERGGTCEWFYRRKGDRFPEVLDRFDALIIFGGEVSVHDPSLKDYFDELSALIHKFSDQRKPILGSCLGSQAIAYAFNATVKPQGFLEYGFTKLSMTKEGLQDPLLHGLPQNIHLFELHSDTFELPVGATLLMTGDAIQNQVYRLGHHIYGFQCHFEINPEIVDTWNRRELIGNPSKDPAQIDALIAKADQDFPRHQTQQQAFGQAVVDRWLNLINTQQGMEEKVI